MRQSELIELYAKVRFCLIVTAPIAFWGFTYWLTGGEMLVSVVFGLTLVLPLLDALPGKAEVKHSLMAERKRQENIWFRMI